MAVYRESPARRINPLVVLIIVIALVAILGGILAVLNRPTEDPKSTLRAKTLETAQGLDILGVEYPKLLQGEPSGAAGSFAKSKATFESIKNDLEKIDANSVSQIAADMATLDQKIGAHAPAEEVIALADQVQQALIALSKSI